MLLESRDKIKKIVETKNFILMSVEHLLFYVEKDGIDA